MVTPTRERAMRITMTFYEIEHEGDLDRVIDDLVKAGARKFNVLSTNFDCEAATIEFDIKQTFAEFLELIEDAPGAGCHGYNDF